MTRLRAEVAVAQLISTARALRRFRRGCSRPADNGGYVGHSSGVKLASRFSYMQDGVDHAEGRFRSVRRDRVDVEDAAGRSPPFGVQHLSILRIMPDNTAYLAEFDNPKCSSAGARAHTAGREVREYGGRAVKESRFEVRDGDWIVLVSDGVLHAGIGGIWNLGWGWERVGEYLCRIAPHEEEAHSFAQGLLETTRKLYAGKPGDDATVCAVRIRAPRSLTVLVGPPVKKSDDARVVTEFMGRPGKKAVCGGTTSLMVSAS